MAESHDALFRFTFSRPEHAAGLLREVLPAGAAAAIDWRTLTPVDGTFVDKPLRRQQSDLLFEARAGAQPVRIYVLIEHKARQDRLAALQMLRYVVGVWQSVRREHPRAAHLPFVLPVLLHHGKRPWRAPRDLADLLDRGSPVDARLRAFMPWQPRFRHVVVSTARWRPEQLRRMAMTLLGKLTMAALQFLPGASHDEVVAAVVQWADLIRQLMLAPSGREAVEALSTYVLQTTAAEPEPLLEVVTKVVEPEAGMTFKTAAARLRAEGRVEGKAEGKAEGRAEGQAEGRLQGRSEGELAGRRELLLQQFTARFGALDERTRAAVAAAGRAQLERWAIHVLQATCLADVFSER